MSSCANQCSVDNKNAPTIPCDVCQELLHFKCAGLPDNDVKFTRNKSKSIKVVCNSCSNNIAQFKDIKTLISNIRSDFNTAIDNLKASFEVQINNLKSSLTPKQEIAPVVFEDVVSEVMERQIRKQNLVLFNVPEQPINLSRDEALIRDRDSVNNILLHINSAYDVSSGSIQRMGKYLAGKNRPVKVLLKNEQEVQNIIRFAKQLKNSTQYKHIFVAFDRTPRQIEYYKLLKDEMDLRTTNGESGLKIRYVKGVPKILN
ncbi:hypothetical protein Zmor_010572 [Zophobas morio]|uniref:Zinc finger PHD-type domain-containing protein n=1 Tax=Zophobas morio TaxID=2755281 RepID=A0AA38MK12_9CUCU|nr:hypothetical protein Zmor_010572 [Zophobas morio]